MAIFFVCAFSCVTHVQTEHSPSPALRVANELVLGLSKRASVTLPTRTCIKLHINLGKNKEIAFTIVCRSLFIHVCS
jgi:hypothetical protein